MKNLAKLFGIIVLVAVIGFVVAGCAVTPNYYSLGDVSEENCAQIVVSPTSNSSSYAFGSFITIDGQGEYSQWKPSRVPFVGGGKAIVRVTPGAHTFEGKIYVSGSDRPIPGSRAAITYDCKAGKGYSFSLDGADSTGLELIIYEYDIDENGKFALLPRVAAKERAYTSGH